MKSIIGMAFMTAETVTAANGLQMFGMGLCVGLVFLISAVRQGQRDLDVSLFNGDIDVLLRDVKALYQ